MTTNHAVRIAHFILSLRTSHPAAIDLIHREGERVLLELNRRNLTQIEIADPQLATRRVFGVFEVDDPLAFATSVLRLHGRGVAMVDRPGRIRLSLLSDVEHRPPSSQ